MKTRTIKMSEKEIQALKKRYSGCEIRTGIQYTYYQIKGSDFTITAYTSGKVVFQAEDLSLHLPDEATKQDTPTNVDMAGSDEVGTGDYFGPITVCAAIVRKEDYKNLPVDKITDSKAMTDTLIMEIAPIIMEHIEYSLLILDNKKYNQIHPTNNINMIKAKLHNKAFLNLEAKAKMPELVVIDQFAEEKIYYRYLQHEPKIYTNLVFETKAESKFIAVACAAIIARYAFLKSLEKMHQAYDFEFPKGAGAHVDEAGINFVKQHGAGALMNVSKYHFKNTERILKEQ